MKLECLLAFYRRTLSAYIPFRFAKLFILIIWRIIYYFAAISVNRKWSGIYHWKPLSQLRELSNQYSTLYPKKHLKIPSPEFIGHYADKAKLRTPKRDLVIHPVSVYEIENALTVSGTDFIFTNNLAIHHDYFVPNEHLCPADIIGVVRRMKNKMDMRLNLLHKEIEINRALSLLGQSNRNYAHWVTEQLPKLTLFIRNGNCINNDGVKLLVEKGLHANIRESIDLLNVEGLQIVEIPRWHAVHVHRLFIISAIGYERYVPYGIKQQEADPYVSKFHPDALIDMKEQLTEIVSRSNNNNFNLRSRLYLQRSKHSGNVRRVVNEDEVIKLMRSLSIECVNPELMTFSEQVRMMSRARLIISPIGAALANMVFAPKGCVIVVLAPYYDEANYFYFTNLAAALGHEIIFVLGKQIEKKRHPMHRDYKINLDDIKLVLNRIIK